MLPLVAIILVNFNSYSDTIECIKSIKNITYENYKIVVVDNGSTKGDEKSITFLKDNTYYIQSKINLGFSGGNNLGINFSKKKFSPDYYLLLNNDTIVKKDFLKFLVISAINNYNTGIICGKICYFDEPEVIWFAGGSFNKKTGMADHIGYNKVDSNFEPFEEEIEFATGCMMLLPKFTIEKVGYLDEEYFLYAEDTDYSCRVRNAGLKIIYNNLSVIYHKVSKSSQNNNLITYYMVRNNLYIIKKYSNKKLYAYINEIILMLKSVIKHENSLKAILYGWIDFLKRKKGKKL